MLFQTLMGTVGMLVVATAAGATPFNFSYDNTANCTTCDSFTGMFDGDVDPTDLTGNRIINVTNLTLTLGSGPTFDFSTLSAGQIQLGDTLSFDGLANAFQITFGPNAPFGTTIISLRTDLGEVAVITDMGTAVSRSRFYDAVRHGAEFDASSWNVTEEVTQAIPEPGAALLFSAGALVIGGSLRRKK